MSSLEQLAETLPVDSPKIPPLDKWQPPLSGDMDMRITRNGRWIHEQDEIKRQALIDLFATILWREGDDYFLKSPVEKWRIQVDDVPFFINQLIVSHDNGQQRLTFTSFTGDTITAGKEHPLRVETHPDTAEPSPYLMIRQGMEGLLSRNVFYELVELAEETTLDGQSALIVSSQGYNFTLGTL